MHETVQPIVLLSPRAEHFNLNAKSEACCLPAPKSDEPGGRSQTPPIYHEPIKYTGASKSASAPPRRGSLGTRRSLVQQGRWSQRRDAVLGAAATVFSLTPGDASTHRQQRTNIARNNQRCPPSYYIKYTKHSAATEPYTTRTRKACDEALLHPPSVDNSNA